jgi:hypothetical protein
MKNSEVLNKQITLLEKMAKEGKDTELSRRLARNLNELKWLFDNRKITEIILTPVVAKQSLKSAVQNSSEVLQKIEAANLVQNLALPETEECDFNQEFDGD